MRLCVLLLALLLVAPLAHADDPPPAPANKVTKSPTLIQAVATNQHVPAVETDLTARESEVLNYIAEGMCNKTIARELGISVGTVKVHVKHVLHKLNLHSRLEAVVWHHQRESPAQRTPS